MDLAVGTQVEFGRPNGRNWRHGKIIKVNKKTYLIKPTRDIYGYYGVEERREKKFVKAAPTQHFFTYDEDGVNFYKDIWQLITQPMVRLEDCYVYEGELDEDNYDDHADDYREQTAEEFVMKNMIKGASLGPEHPLCRNLLPVQPEQPVQAEPVQAQPVQAEPVQAEPSEIELLKAENEKLKAENYKLKTFHFTYDKNVWSPTELLRILDNYDLNWNGVCEEVKKLKEENEALKG
jgi:hypothetical protein